MHLCAFSVKHCVTKNRNQKMKTKFTLSLILLPFVLFSQEIKITNGPYIQKMGETEATIIWLTNNDALSWVELAPAGSDSFYAVERPQFFDTEHGSKKIGKLHKVTVRGLLPGTEYRYRIFSKEVLDYKGHRVMYGNIASSEVYNQKPYAFKTLDAKKDKLAFRVVNDIHAKNDNLRKMLGDVKKENTDLVIFNGDMISMLNNEAEIFTGFMDASVELFAKEIPMFYARGNHETRGKASTKFYDYFPTTNGQYYYTFRDGPVFFLVLDGGEDKPDSDIEYSELAYFDEYRSEQKKWMETVLKSPEFQSAPYRVVIIHIPPTGSSWHGTRDIAEKFIPALNNANIDLMLSGHTHSYKFVKKGEDKNLNFPLLINDDETWLDITADSEKIDVKQKDMTGKTVNVHVFDRRK